MRRQARRGRHSRPLRHLLLRRRELGAHVAELVLRRLDRRLDALAASGWGGGVEAGARSVCEQPRRLSPPVGGHGLANPPASPGTTVHATHISVVMYSSRRSTVLRASLMSCFTSTRPDSLYTPDDGSEASSSLTMWFSVFCDSSTCSACTCLVSCACRSRIWSTMSVYSCETPGIMPDAMAAGCLGSRRGGRGARQGAGGDGEGDPHGGCLRELLFASRRKSEFGASTRPRNDAPRRPRTAVGPPCRATE